tara:strand:- start:2906 stop:3109 length:204 start_codon:yes stop_codon:yes gene_type:complete
MSHIKRNAYDQAEKKIDQYASYLIHNVITYREAVEDLLADPVVTVFFNKQEIEKVLSFELQRGNTLQ